MKLFEQQDDKGLKKKSRTNKELRKLKHREERRAAKRKLDDHTPTYKKYHGYAL